MKKSKNKNKRYVGGYLPVMMSSGRVGLNNTVVDVDGSVVSTRYYRLRRERVGDPTANGAGREVLADGPRKTNTYRSASAKIVRQTSGGIARLQTCRGTRLSQPRTSSLGDPESLHRRAVRVRAPTADVATRSCVHGGNAPSVCYSDNDVLSASTVSV